MLNDLSALAPPFLVCAAFLIAVGAFLRHEMRGKRRHDDRDQPADISADSGIPERGGESGSAKGEGGAAAGQFDGDRS